MCNTCAEIAVEQYWGDFSLYICVSICHMWIGFQQLGWRIIIFIISYLRLKGWILNVLNPQFSVKMTPILWLMMTGPLCGLDIFDIDIDYIREVGPCRSWGCIWTTCAVSIRRNDIKGLLKQFNMFCVDTITYPWHTLLNFVFDKMYFHLYIAYLYPYIHMYMCIHMLFWLFIHMCGH